MWTSKALVTFALIFKLVSRHSAHVYPTMVRMPQHTYLNSVQICSATIQTESFGKHCNKKKLSRPMSRVIQMRTNFHVGTACSSTALNRNEITPCRNIVSNQFSYSTLSTVFFNSTFAIQTLQPHSNAVQKPSPKTSAANTKPRSRLKPTWSSNCFAFCRAQFQFQSMSGMWYQKAQSLSNCLVSAISQF